MISSRLIARASLACAATLVIHATANAQITMAQTSPWRALVGCWRPLVQVAPTDVALSDAASEADRQLARRAFAMLDSVRARDLTARAPLVCIVPATTSSSVVDVVTVDSGKVASRFTIDATGQERAVNRDGCSGWEKAQWSQDNRRVLLRSELACPSGKRVVTGMMALAALGEWIDIQSISAAGNTAVRTVRYRDAGIPSTVPAEVAAAVTGNRSPDTRALAIAGERDLKPTAVVEAMRLVDTSVVQGWLIERHQPLGVDARSLIALADAGVPGSVTDVLVALSHPEQFRFDRGPMPGDQLSGEDSARIAREYAWNRGIGCDQLTTYSSFGWGFDPCYGYRYGMYEYGRYGYYGYDRLYGVGAYYNPTYYGYYTRPVVIVREADTPHGRAVNGQGYTRGDAGSSSSSSPSASRSGGSSSGGSAPSSSSGSASSGSSSSGSSGSSSSGRTAKTRPPQ